MVDEGFREELRCIRDQLSWIAVEAPYLDAMTEARTRLDRLIAACAEPAAGTSQYHGIIPAEEAGVQGERME
jgi:hypothetical protein